MGLNSFTVICQSIVKTLVGPLLVLFGYGVLGAVLGYTVSFLAAGIIGLGVLYVALFRPLKKSKVKMSELTKTLKGMLKYGVPLSISSILTGVLGNFYSFMMAYLVSDIMIGNYQAAVNFAVLLGFFTMPISTVLFPAFAKLDPQNERQLLRTVFTSSIKYAAMLLVPATMAMMILSGPMISTLFGEKYVYAPFFLTLYVISNLFVVLGNLSLNSFLTGLGETKIPMKQGILTLSIGIPLGFFLIPMYGILGLILATLLANLPSIFWGLYWIWKHYEARADFKSSAKILLASTIATFATYLLLSFFNTVDLVRLIAGGAVFLAVYILTAPMIGAITQTDIGNLRTMLSGLGIISRMLTGPLILVEKVAGHAPTSAGWKNRKSKGEKDFE
jgi:O-antigen/teichoic acid export membrane protein